MNLGDLVKQFRKVNKITMEEFGNRSGLSKGYISMLERNSNPATGKAIAPSLEAIKKVSDAMGMDVNDVINMLDDESEIELDNKTIYGDHQANLDYFSDKPELLDIYKEIHDSESLQLLFDSAKDLTPQDLEMVLVLIKGIKSERQGN